MTTLRSPIRPKRKEEQDYDPVGPIDRRGLPEDQEKRCGGDQDPAVPQARCFHVSGHAVARQRIVRDEVIKLAVPSVRLRVLPDMLEGERRRHGKVLPRNERASPVSAVIEVNG